MALTAYQTALQNLIQAPSSPVALISTTQQTTYINTARNQVAGDAECIRVPATLTLSNPTQSYNFSSISVGGAAGVGSVMSVRSARIVAQPLDVRPWEWFAQYYLGNATTGTPVHVAQQGQGVSGTLYFYPIPSGAFTVSLDVVCLPIALVNDSTAEAIPQLWTDAIVYYAAWLALQSLQRQADAETMLSRYQLLIRRGREMGTPSELPQYMPGGLGTQLAAATQTLGQPPAQPAARGQ